MMATGFQFPENFVKMKPMMELQNIIIVPMLTNQLSNLMKQKLNDKNLIAHD